MDNIQEAKTYLTLAQEYYPKEPKKAYDCIGQAIRLLNKTHLRLGNELGVFKEGQAEESED